MLEAADDMDEVRGAEKPEHAHTYTHMHAQSVCVRGRETRDGLVATESVRSGACHPTTKSARTAREP